LADVWIGDTRYVLHERQGIWRSTGQGWFDGGLYAIDDRFNVVFLALSNWTVTATSSSPPARGQDDRPVSGSDSERR
jgi:hypothetical protein